MFISLPIYDIFIIAAHAKIAIILFFIVLFCYFILNLNSGIAEDKQNSISEGKQKQHKIVKFLFRQY